MSKRYDVTINGVGYLLAKQQQPDGTEPRIWKRTKVVKSTFQYDLRNVHFGEGYFGKVVEERSAVFFNFPAQGWGQLDSLPNAEGFYGYGEDVDASSDNQVFLSPKFSTADSGKTAGALPRYIYELANNSSEVYIAYGRYILAFNPSTGAVRSVADTDADADMGAGYQITQVAIMDGKALICSYNTSTGVAQAVRIHSYSSSDNVTVGASGTIPSGTNLDSIVLSSDTLGTCCHVGYRDSNGVTKIGKLSGGADPSLAASYSSGAAFGDSATPIRWLNRYGYQVFGALPDGFYGFDQNLNSPNVIPDIRYYRSADNAKQTIQFAGNLFIPTILGIYMYDGQVYVDVSPSLGSTYVQDENSRYFGYCTALVSDAYFLYAVMWNGTDTYIFKGRKGVTGEPPIVWNTWKYISGQGPFTVATLTALTTNPTMILVQQAATKAIHYLTLPRAANPLQDPQPTTRSGKFYTMSCNWGLPGRNKVFSEAIISGKKLSSSDKFTLYFRMGITGSWQSLGDVTATNTILRPSNGQTVTGECIQFRVDFTAASTTTATPILNSIEAIGFAELDQAEQWQLTLVLEDQKLDRDGIEGKQASQLASNLTSLEGRNRTAPFTFIDVFDVSHSAVLVGPVEMTEKQFSGEGRFNNHPQRIGNALLEIIRED